MTTKTAIPLLGEALRELVTRGGLRKALEERGFKKDLDDLAIERYPGSLCEQLENLETNLFAQIALGTGAGWADLCRNHWLRAKAVIQFVASETDTSAMPPENGRLYFHASVSVFLVGEFLQEAARRFPGPELKPFIEAPFKHWMEWRGVKSVDLAEAAEVDQKTMARWRKGSRIESLSFPFVKVMRETASKNNPTSESVAAGWLMVAMALQSLEDNFLDSLKWLNSQPQKEWPPLPGGIRNFDEQATDFLEETVHLELLEIDRQVYDSFSKGDSASGLAKKRVGALNDAVAKRPLKTREYWLPIIEGYLARLAALRGDDEEASDKFRNSVSALWWRKGRRGVQIINSAMTFSVGIGDRANANRYWGMLSFLGQHRSSYFPLDSQYIRMYSVLFEQEFWPRKAKENVYVGIDLDTKPFQVTRDMRRKPKQLAKLHEGRLRLDFLMRAILKGTVTDVRELLAAGGDLNASVPESGETPLSCALRRAVDGKQPESLFVINDLASGGSLRKLDAFRAANAEILYEILQLNVEPLAGMSEQGRINKETANRPFGMSETPDTPMKLAIDMADAKVVRRLAEFGADIHTTCANTSNALLHAMSKYAHAFKPEREEESLRSYLNGEGAATGYDAFQGAVLGEQLAAVRTRSFAAQMQSGNPEKQRALWQAIMAYNSRPPDALLSVIEALLDLGADPNSRYMKDGNHWSATLLAADIGSPPLMRLMLSRGGDPTLSLDNPHLWINQRHVTEKQDALWIAGVRNYLTVKDLLMAHEKGIQPVGDS